MGIERRCALRVPDCRIITEINKENPSSSSVVNVSSTGVYTVKPKTVDRLGPRKVQLEIPLPEVSETVWALGEVVFDRVSRKACGSGIRFLAMAGRDERLIQELIEYRRHEIVGQMMREIRWRKELAAHPSPFAAPPPPVRETTVPMWLIPPRGDD